LFLSFSKQRTEIHTQFSEITFNHAFFMLRYPSFIFEYTSLAKYIFYLPVKGDIQEKLVYIDE
jgi:hypothetical protein